jgi:hypothetical protein
MLPDIEMMPLFHTYYAMHTDINKHARQVALKVL